ncbi:MAG: enoyl-[acyl-carrier-protein] reductase FabK [Eubacteriales bacterium]|jgi:enoyl-[acyl-carrier protein] reductase II
MIKTRITELLNIQYPIIQGGMAWVADANLAAAVSNAGGLGLIAGGAAPAEVIRQEILKVREMTDKPFGVNIMLLNPNTEELANLVVEMKVPVVTTGAGSPTKYIKMWHEAGIKVLPVMPNAQQARRMEKYGADAVIVEGCEAGGHIGEITTMVLTPETVDNVSIPVITAGGVADGRGIAAAFMLGAEGVQVGTRFLSAEECNIHEEYKKLVLKAKGSDTAVTGRSNGHPVRALKNRLTRQFLEMEKAGVSFEELEHLTVGSLRKAVKDGNLEEGSFMSGQSAGLVHKLQPCREIIEEMFSEAEQLLKNPLRKGVEICE